MAGSCVPCEARVKYLTIQHNRLGINFFSIQKCNCGIRPIWGKMRSTVWTVQIHVAIHIFRAPNSRSGGHDFESLLRVEMGALTKVERPLGSGLSTVVTQCDHVMHTVCLAA